MTYDVRFSEIALNDLKLLKRHDRAAYKKALKLIEELYIHPESGTGHPEPLKGDRRGQWSRRISHKHRLVYKIENHVLVVLVLCAIGHYGDK